MLMQRISTAIPIAPGSIAISTASPDTVSAKEKAPRYNATVQRTSYGVPHIRASDWGSRGYGYGYAFARDNLCALARDVLEATGTQSRYFGAVGINVAEDWVYTMVNSDARAEASFAQLDSDSQDLVKGYAAGYNRYLADTGVDALDPACRGTEWVRPIDHLDVMKVLAKLTMRAGIATFISSIAGAAPPVALGRDHTGGAGALLGNPHFPWFGIERFYAVHLTVAGRYDVMGSSIFGFPLVNIGFSKDVAWSHTVSTARRFVLRELRLAPGNPTGYVYDGAVVPMTTVTVSIDVLLPGGTIGSLPHMFHISQFGPMMVLATLANWSTTRAFALTDVNIDNTCGFKKDREMGQSRNVHEFEAAMATSLGSPWVNTVAADSDGGAFYGDVTTVPHVTNAKLAAWDGRNNL